jgi:hypothetical protein
MVCWNFEKFGNFKKIKNARNCPKAHKTKNFEFFEKIFESGIFQKFWFCALFGQFPAFFDFSKILKKFQNFFQISQIGRAHV